MVNKILGLDLGTNSIGWALLEANEGNPGKIIDIGSRIFTKAVEEKIPTPKNVKRRDSRLTRRVIQRRARRKKRMLNYLVKLNLLPKQLQQHSQPEILLNELGDPYLLRAKALDKELDRHQLGRVLLHLVQRRGFLSSRKNSMGDMVDDPDVIDILNAEEQSNTKSSSTNAEETEFKADISVLRETIAKEGFRTLGEYLGSFSHHECQRNRIREGGHLRTDRQMYRDELNMIWNKQCQFHSFLNDDIKNEIVDIIFKQRPLKLRSDRIGKCSLETKNNRSRLARLECQQFRYLQDINNLQYIDPYTNKSNSINDEDRNKLIKALETQKTISFAGIKKLLGFDRKIDFNLDIASKIIKGNITACEISKVLPQWSDYSIIEKKALVEDLITIKKKSVLKKRLLSHWKFDTKIVVKLCLLEFEPGHSNHSTKAINKLLPFLENGQIYSDARISAGYDYKKAKISIKEKLGLPPETSNPIVNKALHEIRRLINAIIKEYGKPDVIRVEMARDLEMNTKRYKSFIRQQKDNTKANIEAVDQFKGITNKNKQLGLSAYPSRDDKIKYRLWKDQRECCAYSGKSINLTTLFTSTIEIDHILPYSESLDNSYMNKVVSFAVENQIKGQRTPIEAFGSDEAKWNQITQATSRWDKKLKSKVSRFYTTKDELLKRDFISNQLNDTRYISKVAYNYLAELGVEVTTSKGITTSWVRHQWGLNSLIGETNKKERTDHRHHLIDAVVVACVDRKFYQSLVSIAKDLERQKSNYSMNDLHTDSPWESLRDDLKLALNDVIVSHSPLYKINGELHEKTAVGYIEGKGTVYRDNLNSAFKPKRVKNIIDDSIRERVAAHIEKFSNIKEAFNGSNILYHKDGKTPIKRVRTLQSKTTLKKLEKNKMPFKNSEGKIFKWTAYGSIHRVEIFQHQTTNKVKSVFITMLEARHRALNINGKTTTPILDIPKSKEYDLLMVLCKNDMVSVEIDGVTRIYRVQKLEQPTNITLRLHTAAKIDNKSEEIRKSISTLIDGYKMTKCRINVIGKKI